MLVYTLHTYMYYLHEKSVPTIKSARNQSSLGLKQNIFRLTMNRPFFLFLALVFQHFESIYCIYGQDAKSAVGSQPASAVVLIDNGYRINDPPYCMGALLTSLAVITIGNCCNPKKDFDVIITVGATRLHDEGDFYYVEKYLMLGGKNDICLIRLNRRVLYTKYALPVGLPLTTDKISDSDSFEIYGFGAMEVTDPLKLRYLANEMQRIKLPIVDVAKCEKAHGRIETKEKLFCAGEEKGSRLMKDDHGAPLISDRMLLGLALTYMGKEVKEGAPSYFISIPHAQARILEGLKKMLAD